MRNMNHTPCLRTTAIQLCSVSSMRKMCVRRALVIAWELNEPQTASMYRCMYERVYRPIQRNKKQTRETTNKNKQQQIKGSSATNYRCDRKQATVEQLGFAINSWHCCCGCSYRRRKGVGEQYENYCGGSG